MKRRLACVWLADDQSVKWSAPGGGGDGGLERLAAVDWRGAKIAALMPPERVLLTAAQAPTASRKTAIAAAPFAIEEKLLEDLETAAVVVADKREASGLWSVAACSREWIADQISQLDKVGNIRPALVLPACLALPYPADGWAIADYEGRRMARLGRAHGFAAEAALADETLARFWRRQPPRIVRYYPDSQTPRWQPPTAAEGAEKEAVAAETIVDIDADADLLELFKRGLQQQPAGINSARGLAAPRRQRLSAALASVAIRHRAGSGVGGGGDDSSRLAKRGIVAPPFGVADAKQRIVHGGFRRAGGRDLRRRDGRAHSARRGRSANKRKRRYAVDFGGDRIRIARRDHRARVVRSGRARRHARHRRRSRLSAPARRAGAIAAVETAGGNLDDAARIRFSHFAVDRGGVAMTGFWARLSDRGRALVLLALALALALVAADFARELWRANRQLWSDYRVEEINWGYLQDSRAFLDGQSSIGDSAEARVETARALAQAQGLGGAFTEIGDAAQAEFRAVEYSRLIAWMAELTARGGEIASADIRAQNGEGAVDATVVVR